MLPEEPYAQNIKTSLWSLAQKKPGRTLQEPGLFQHCTGLVEFLASSHPYLVEVSTVPQGVQDGNVPPGLPIRTD